MLPLRRGATGGGYGRDRKLGNQELREAYLFTSFFPEDYPRPFV